MGIGLLCMPSLACTLPYLRTPTYTYIHALALPSLYTPQNFGEWGILCTLRVVVVLDSFLQALASKSVIIIALAMSETETWKEGRALRTITFEVTGAPYEVLS